MPGVPGVNQTVFASPNQTAACVLSSLAALSPAPVAAGADAGRCANSAAKGASRGPQSVLLPDLQPPPALESLEALATPEPAGGAELTDTPGGGSDRLSLNPQP